MRSVHLNVSVGYNIVQINYIGYVIHLQSVNK
jgi:hypothetical protein